MDRIASDIENAHDEYRHLKVWGRMTEPVIIVDYDPNWPAFFESLRVTLATVLGPITAAIEHVGSTAVEGLASKPIIDIDVLLDAECNLVPAIAKLESVGYEHQGNLGIAGREAFLAPVGSHPHHLYVCQPGSEEFGRHIAFRDFLRTHPEAVSEYARLKQELSARYRHSRAAYSEGKSGFILSILSLLGLSQDTNRWIPRQEFLKCCLTSKEGRFSSNAGND